MKLIRSVLIMAVLTLIGWIVTTVMSGIPMRYLAVLAGLAFVSVWTIVYDLC